MATAMPWDRRLRVLADMEQRRRAEREAIDAAAGHYSPAPAPAIATAPDLPVPAEPITGGRQATTLPPC